MTGFEAPAVAVIGQVVNWHDILHHCAPKVLGDYWEAGH